MNEQLRQTIEDAARRGLRALDLADNGITELPKEIGNLVKLLELNIRGNHFTMIPPEVGKLAKLTELNLRDNELTALPPEIGNLTALSVLDIANNHLTTLPKEIGNLTQLTELYLGGNGLSTLPTEFDRLTNLMLLGLMCNKLSQFPIQITKIRSLRQLNLGNDTLTSLPREIGNLINLRELYLMDNEITSLPSEIGRLKYLTIIDLANNRVTALPYEMGELVRLEMLDLRGNSLLIPSENLEKTDNPTEIIVQCLFPYLPIRMEPYTGEWDGSLVQRYHYDVLPPNVIVRFILLMHSHILQDTYWRSGVVLEYGKNKALIKANLENREIEIYIKGDPRTQRACLELIRSNLESIHETIRELNVTGTTMLSDKPKVFIGSSSEGHAIARHLQLGLEYVVECTIWSQGVFGLSRGNLENLVEAAPQFDFAVLVLTPDDLVTKREASGNIPRDNVIFELGLFMGVLGRDKTFMVSCREDILELPSDLAGVQRATYGRRGDGNLEAAMGPVCTRLQQAMGI